MRIARTLRLARPLAMLLYTLRYIVKHQRGRNNLRLPSLVYLAELWCIVFLNRHQLSIYSQRRRVKRDRDPLSKFVSLQQQFAALFSYMRCSSAIIIRFDHLCGGVYVIYSLIRDEKSSTCVKCVFSTRTWNNRARARINFLKKKKRLNVSHTYLYICVYVYKFAISPLKYYYIYRASAILQQFNFMPRERESCDSAITAYDACYYSLE